MNFKQFLTLIKENVRKRSLYHSTHEWHAILASRRLSPSVPERGHQDTDIEIAARYNPKGTDNFVSFARSIGNSYNKGVVMSGSRTNVTLEFDGNAMARRYRIVPVDFLKINNPLTPNRERDDSEYEERIFTNKDIFIEDYLTAVHVYDPRMASDFEDMVRFGSEDYRKAMVVRLTKEHETLYKMMQVWPNIPFYFYKSEANYYNARWAEAAQLNPALFSKDQDEDLDESFQPITEGRAVAPLFHYSPAHNLILLDGILKARKIVESSVEFDVSGGKNIIKKYGDRYISFARSITSIFIRKNLSNSTVVFEFDRDALKANYKIIPVNWQYGHVHPSIINEPDFKTRRSVGIDEKEDRLLTKKKGIPLTPYLTGVHVYSSDDEHADEDLDGAKYSLDFFRSNLENLNQRLKVAKERNANAAAVYEIETKISQTTFRIAELEAEIEKLKGRQRHFGIDKKMFDKYPNVPFWAYTKWGAFKAGRFAEAIQINPNVEGYDEDDDEEL